jgi:hypothetical protein
MPNLLTQQKVASFLAEQVEAEDFAGLEWQEPDQVISLCETLNGYPFKDEFIAQRARAHAGNLLRHALQGFERQQEFEKMFQLLRLAPVSPSTKDSELLRLRNRAYLYEMRRMRRYRRLLYTYLLVQLFLIVLVFPFLFINAENGRIQAEIEEATEVDLSSPQDQHQLLSYTDGLYWSLITAGSIGYGDITPKTNVGRVIAAFLGVMGVVTVGVVAGLVLQWITPRRLE